MRIPTAVLSLIIFLVIAALLVSVRAQVSNTARTICTGSNGMYFRNSTFQNNLYNLLSNLSTNVGSDGFYSQSFGQSSDTVNGVVLCRGDNQLDACRACVRDATTDILRLCPNLVQAVRWVDLCTLRYSDQPLLGTMDTIINASTISRTGNVTSPDDFRANLMSLVDDLRSQASNSSFSRKVATGNISTTGFQTIYALVQCTPNLVPRDCVTCLRAAAEELPTAVAARSFMPNCNIQYDLTLFYNETRLQEFTTEGGNVAGNQTAPGPEAAPPQSQQVVGAARTTRRNIIIGVVSGSVVGLIIALCVTLIVRRSTKGSWEKLDRIGESIQEFDFGEIKRSTGNFSAEQLGEGGFGVVYKGQNRGQDVAVKKLSLGTGSCQGDDEFRAEVNILAKLRHTNLVQLVGFSSQKHERLLVYEYVKNGSLDKFLYDKDKLSELDWKKRYMIIEGIVKGIVYLHHDSGLKVIHRDIKPSNVLLDEQMNSKIADFGLARLLKLDVTHANTDRVAGTRPYMAPEYREEGDHSFKSDVFSFGVILLEIISGQENNYGTGRTLLFSTAWEHWSSGNRTKFADPRLVIDDSNESQFLKCFHVALLCTQPEIHDRPLMSEVLTMLNSPSMPSKRPSEPGYGMPRRNMTTFYSFNKSRESYCVIS